MTCQSKWLHWAPKKPGQQTDRTDRRPVPAGFKTGAGLIGPAPGSPYAFHSEIEKPAKPPSVGIVSAKEGRFQHIPDLGDRIEERAAILEHDAGYDRDDADRLAAAYETIPDTVDGWSMGVARLHVMVPAGVPDARWQRFLADADNFMLDWAERAADCGWFALDLFGVHLAAPLARFNCGLVWLLHGDRVVDLDRDGAVIETGTGVRQTFRLRRPYDPGIGPAWAMPLAR